MKTNDHTVPQSYLRRFAEERRGRGQFIVATEADHVDRSFETNVRNIAAVKGFYWASLDDGTSNHDAEHLFARVEAATAPAFAAMLDDHKYALSQRWPLPVHLRERLAWWMAAQVLRTTRQRKRLAHLLDESAPGLQLPSSLRKAAATNLHIAYVASQLGRLAGVLYGRPWGLGFSDACLLTSDVPVVLLNQHDAHEQVLAAAVCDILLALDPHRFLFLPGAGHLEDRRKQVDHRLKFDGGMGLALSEIIRDAADRHLLHHPVHPPQAVHSSDIRPRLARPWEGEDPKRSPQYSLSYNVLPAEYGVERRWLNEHPPRRSAS
ncbi:MAG TPA: DUF4238 domain-containing protein [Acidimicrobiales bacterium]|nr:DUF4238 domain-containing protein [Acidimicrobiales bacterium]